jgi:hypothetical protein
MLMVLMAGMNTIVCTLWAGIEASHHQCHAAHVLCHQMPHHYVHNIAALQKNKYVAPSTNSRESHVPAQHVMNKCTGPDDGGRSQLSMRERI